MVVKQREFTKTFCWSRHMDYLWTSFVSFGYFYFTCAAGSCLRMGINKEWLQKKPTISFEANMYQKILYRDVEHSRCRPAKNCNYDDRQSHRQQLVHTSSTITSPAVIDIGKQASTTIASWSSWRWSNRYWERKAWDKRRASSLLFWWCGVCIRQSISSRVIDKEVTLDLMVFRLPMIDSEKNIKTFSVPSWLFMCFSMLEALRFWMSKK